MKIILQRPNEKFNKYTPYKVFANTTEITELKNGENKEVEINEDELNINAKLSFCGSNKIDIKELNNNDTIIIKGNYRLNRFMPFSGALAVFPAMFIVGNYGITAKYIGTILTSIILLFIIWTMTLGKNKWLELEHKNNE